MKKLILGLLLVTSLPTFAAVPTLKDCKSVLGEYTCKFQGETLPLSITKGSAANSVKISIAGEEETYIVDGVIRGPIKDLVIAQCADNGYTIRVQTSFKGEDQVIKLTSRIFDGGGVVYSVEKPESTLSLNCTK